MKNCLRCGIEIDGSYGSGRFCSVSCANNRGTRSIETRKKISEALKKSDSRSPDKGIKSVSSRTMIKILRRMNLRCFSCGWGFEGVSCDVHHIIPKKDGGSDADDNLTYLCPNCHRLAHSNLLSITSSLSIRTVIGDSWKEHYNPVKK